MRPRKLIVTAFGPFANTVEVDFTRFEGRDLVLIEGPTGAGKTSLLDAMTYALFGAVPGARHEVETELRSAFAEAHAVCEVSFEFALGERFYRAVRQPGQERARKRGAGKVSQKPEAHLFDVTDGLERPVCPPKVFEVDAAVQRLLGLSVEQFKQVLLLPQGEFRELLLAKSSDKEALLEKLFGTSLYKDVAERLGSERRALERRYLEIGKLQTELLGQRGVASVDGLDAALAGAAAQVATAVAAAEQAGQAAQVARARHARAAALAERLVARAKARVEVEQAERAWAQAEPARVAIADAERAEPVAAALAQLAGEAERRTQAARAALEATAALAGALRQVEAAAGRAKLLPARRAELDVLGVRESLLAQLAPVAAELARAREEHKTTARRRKDAEARLAQLDEAERKARAADAALGERAQRAEAAAGDEAALSDAANAARERAERRRELAELHARLAAARHEYAQRHALVLAQRTQVTEARTAVERRREAREANLAAELAQGLREGSPCPVCGSAEHPQPARTGAGAVTADHVAEAEKRHAELARHLTQLESELAARAAEGRTLDQRAQALAQALGAAAAAEHVEQVQAAALAAVARRDGARKAAEELRAIARERQAGAAQLETLARERRTVSEAHAEASGRLAALVGKGTELAAQVKTALPDGGALEDARAALAERRRVVEAELVAIEAEDRRVRDAHAAAQARQEQAAQAELAQRALHERVEAEVAAAARAHGFADAAEARARLVAPVELRERRAAQVELERRRTQASDCLADAEAQLAAARGADEGAADVDVVDLADVAARAAELAAADGAAKAAVEQLGSARTLEAELHRMAQTVRARADEQARVEAELRVFGQLARVCAGENPLKMSLGRFVLAARMEEVAVAASERLFAMSRGRYRLRRTDEVRHAGRGSGLDLVVDDAMTGSERSVHSLSGGEMFLASLSLAMGLADVVQAHAGGIRLDSLFIDEGFGTLDDDTLDQVMRTLEDLRVGGRLVGLISHVNELKERLSTRLTVVKGTRGSLVRMVV